MTSKAGDLKPTPAEKEFLTIAYNRFYDLFDQIISDSFWEEDAHNRLAKIRDIFCVYSELLRYEPLKQIIAIIREKRPPGEAELASELPTFIRNVISHFPFFSSWDDIWINSQIVNWSRDGQFIDRYLRKHEGHRQFKYRFWEAISKRMTYLSINFPTNYSTGNKILIREMLSEKEGVKFSIILMKKVLDTQVEK